MLAQTIVEASRTCPRQSGLAPVEIAAATVDRLPPLTNAFRLDRRIAEPRRRPDGDDRRGQALTILFKVPELRRKILMTAMFLAIYRIGFYIPLPIVDQAKLENWQEQQSTNAAGKVFGTVAMFGGTSDRHEHDLRPGDHALHLGLDHLPAPGQRRPLARGDDEGGGERPEDGSTNTRDTPPSSSARSRARSGCST